MDAVREAFITTRKQHFFFLSQNFSITVKRNKNHTKVRTGHTYRSNVAVGTAFIYTYGKQVLLFITYSSCTTEQATCDVKDNTLIFTLNTRATTLSPVG